jgi:hypothetical protein
LGKCDASLCINGDELFHKTALDTAVVYARMGREAIPDFFSVASQAAFLFVRKCLYICLHLTRTPANATPATRARAL